MYHPMIAVYDSQPISHISVDLVILNYLASHNCKLRNMSQLPLCPAPNQLLPNWMPSCPPPISCSLSLLVHVQAHSIPASNWISEITQSQPTSASLKWNDHGLQEHFKVYMITVWWTGGACMQRAPHQSSATPLTAPEVRSGETVITAGWASEEGYVIWCDTPPWGITQSPWIDECCKEWKGQNAGND